MFKIFTILFFLLVATNYAEASSAVAYGLKTVHSNENMQDREIAVQKALEACSKVDTHCKLVVKCGASGFGAVAVERTKNTISSIGAICAAQSMEKAKKSAMERCSESNEEAVCKIIAQWRDKTQ
ncbi:MAG: DUF4189 domain-containing protein [Alphaproteobacteria bacterium]|nr:DUF4189 domain-containing protein [Alphaproteobacteria bacterium]